MRAAEWLKQWDVWARGSRASEIYRSLFDIQAKANQQCDEFELVLGLGRLRWSDSQSEPIDRHLFTLPITAQMDKQKGSIIISLAEEPSLRAELEAVPLEKLEDGRFIQDLRARVLKFEDEVLSARGFRDLGQYTANGLTTSAEYCDALVLPPSGQEPVIAWAPALILRPRRMAGLATTFRSIAEQIAEGDEVPDGLRTLVDPDFSSTLETSSTPGALTTVGGELFSPLPLNRKQQRVLERVDSHAHTIVQGPPGTGKTHMAAALLSHLLAQGKRVLVTAETERALYELRDKLPPEIRELAVSVVGSSTTEMAELRTAIATIHSKSSNFDAADSVKAISSLEFKLDGLREKRTRALREWSQKLEDAQREISVGGYRVPLPQAVQRIQSESERYSWIEGIEVNNIQSPFPLGAEEVKRATDLLNDPEVCARLDYRGNDVLDPQLLPSAHLYAAAVDHVAAAESAVSTTATQIPEEISAAWTNLETGERQDAQCVVSDFFTDAQNAKLASGPWENDLDLNSSARDIAAAVDNAHALRHKIEALNEWSAGMEGLHRISVEGPTDAFVPIANSLRGYLVAGNRIATRPDGSVKIGMFAPKVVKLAETFFEKVRVNSLPPVTLEAVDSYLAYVEVEWGLLSLQKEWTYTDIDIRDPRNSVSRIRADIEAYCSYVESLSRVSGSIAKLRSFSLISSAQQAAVLAEYLPELEKLSEAQVQLAAARENLASIAQALSRLNYAGTLHPWLRRYQEAVRDRDIDLYQDALSEGQAFHRAGLLGQELADILCKISEWSEDLAKAVIGPDGRGSWVPRLGDSESARNWLRARREAIHRIKENESDPISEIEGIDQEIRATVSALAAQRAWDAAAGSERITGEMRETMVAYAQSVKRLGKGTGKYADRHRRDVRNHLQRARAAVPVWIMPIYKVVEQFKLDQNMFDVVIVDEASQAGVEALFLQYLAPRIVVIGDDHQVSPTAVGQGRDQLRSIARQYLYDFHNVDAWTDPERSLFDDANMRYGGRIALDEHRRCVPEIIEFSNELTYRPNNIELKPVRMIEADRLAPFRITHTPNAFVKGTQKTNTVEADALVSRLLQALNDPRYAGKTFGVISLLSTSKQESYIQARLLNALPPAVWEERDLKVGKPADFQGAERDVVFLSLVTPSPQGERLSSLTREMYIQRYNVAVSRAKDQIWLFHSVGKEEFANHDDVRYKLLEYAYRVALARPELNRSTPVPSEDPVEPFDSLFEQRVYNDLVHRGYHVIPQFDAYGRRIDLVVQGRDARLAVECDGDYWHSEEHAIKDQSRQRELERLGWKFVRVFESDYYLDGNEQIQRIIDKLNAEGITPWSFDCDEEPASNVEVIESIDDIPDLSLPMAALARASSLSADTEKDDKYWAGAHFDL